MDTKCVKTILGELSPRSQSLKSLVEALRQAVFAARNISILTGTDSSLNSMDKLDDEALRALRVVFLFINNNKYRCLVCYHQCNARAGFGWLSEGQPLES